MSSDFSGYLSAVLDFMGGIEQRESQEQMFESGQQFNSAEAAKVREFNAEQSAIGREWAGQQADVMRSFNVNEANENRAFQERMSSTAWQRAMADMEAGGINPMLAFMKGGAAAPAGSMASSSVASSANAAAGSAAHSPNAPRVENMIKGSVHSALMAEKLGADVEVSRQQARLIGAQADNEAYRPTDNLEDEHGTVRAPTAKASNVMADTDVKRALANKSTEEIKVIEPMIRKILNEAYHLATGSQRNIQEGRKLIEERLNVIQQRGLINAETRHVIAGAILQELEAPRARNLANVQDSPWMIRVSPYLRDLFTTGASAAALRSSTR